MSDDLEERDCAEGMDEAFLSRALSGKADVTYTRENASSMEQNRLKNFIVGGSGDMESRFCILSRFEMWQSEWRIVVGVVKTESGAIRWIVISTFQPASCSF